MSMEELDGLLRCGDRLQNISQFVQPLDEKRMLENFVALWPERMVAAEALAGQGLTQIDATILFRRH